MFKERYDECQKIFKEDCIKEFINEYEKSKVDKKLKKYESGKRNEEQIKITNIPGQILTLKLNHIRQKSKNKTQHKI